MLDHVAAVCCPFRMRPRSTMAKIRGRTVCTVRPAGVKDTVQCKSLYGRELTGGNGTCDQAGNLADGKTSFEDGNIEHVTRRHLCPGRGIGMPDGRGFVTVQRGLRIARDPLSSPMSSVHRSPPNVSKEKRWLLVADQRTPSSLVSVSPVMGNSPRPFPSPLHRSGAQATRSHFEELIRGMALKEMAQCVLFDQKHCMPPSKMHSLDRIG
jgi:hypothetical protein